MNYWNIDINELPSRGKEYPKDSYFRLRPLTVGNCKYLSTLNPNNPEMVTRMLNEIFRSCVDTNVEFERIVYADRDYMMYWIRVNSFISSSGYELTIKCPICGKSIHKDLRLNDLDIKYYDDCKFHTVNLTVGDKDIIVNPNIPLVGETRARASDPVVEDILNYTNIKDYIPANADPEWYVTRLAAMDFAELKTLAEKSKFGMISIVELKCDDCGGNLRVDVDLKDTNMFGRISLYEILKIQVQVSKYCGLQITDDWSYTDVELVQEVVKEFVEAEKAEYEKQKGNASSFARPDIKLPRLK